MEGSREDHLNALKHIQPKGKCKSELFKVFKAFKGYTICV